MTEADNRKKMRFTERNDILQEELQKREKSLRAGTQHFQKWKQVMAYISSIETHGSKKESEMTWNEYFKKAFELEENDETFLWPPTFDNAEMPFEDVVWNVAMIINQTVAEKTTAEKKFAEMQKRMKQTEERRERTIARESKMVEKAIALADGGEEARKKDLNLGQEVSLIQTEQDDVLNVDAWDKQSLSNRLDTF